MSSDIKNVDLTLAIPLRQLGDEKRAIEGKLNGLISQYLPEADGVLIKWSDLNILNDKGIILDDQPYVFWKVSFTARVFRPIEGKKVTGKIQRLLKCYFLATAMNSFTVTVSIPEPLLKDETVENLKVEQEVYFKIKGSLEGVYRGEMDEECIELTKGLINQEMETDADRGVYDYAKEFEY